MTPNPTAATAAPQVSEGTLLARKRTSFALERSFLAFERTLMAWLRTSMSMVSFGFTLAKLFDYLGDKRGRPVAGTFGWIWTPATVGAVMVCIGTGALAFAVFQHWRRVRALRAEGLAPQWNLAFYVALLVTALGGFALLTLLFGR